MVSTKCFSRDLAQASQAMLSASLLPFSGLRDPILGGPPGEKVLAFQFMLMCPNLSRLGLPHQNKETEGSLFLGSPGLSLGSRCHRGVQGAHCDFPPGRQTQPGGCTHSSASRFVLPQGLPPRLVSALPSVPCGVERLQNPSGYRERGTDMLFLVLWEKS